MLVIVLLPHLSSLLWLVSELIPNYVFHCISLHCISNVDLLWVPSTSGSRGEAHPAPPPPIGRGPMIFLCPKRLIFSFFPSLASLAIHFRAHFNRTMPKNTLKWLFTSNVNTFKYFLNPPPPVDKVHAPLRSNPGSATAEVFRKQVRVGKSELQCDVSSTFW